MEPAPTLELLREELRRAIREKSLRQVARELVISPTGLKKLLERPDSTLYGKTLRKLIPWYEHRITRQLAAPAAEDVAPAVQVLTRGMAPGEARRVREEISGIMGQVFAGRQGVEEAVAAARGE